jgi:hypothetical protein
MAVATMANITIAIFNPLFNTFCLVFGLRRPAGSPVVDFAVRAKKVTCLVCMQERIDGTQGTGRNCG